MKIIEKANLPQNDISLAAVSFDASEAIQELSYLGIDIVKIYPSDKINNGLAAHADLHMLHIGGKELWITPDQKQNYDKLIKVGFDVHLLKNHLSPPYPKDVPLNAAVIGQKVFLNPKTISSDIGFNEKEIINIKQGYSKCPILVVNDNAIITDDIGIHRTAKSNGFDSLLVEKGDILLRGFNYGFIGGCCGLISKDTVLFNGDLRSHRNSDKIESFLLNYKIYPISIGTKRLQDIGGILPLCEK